jgi:hypothetical protein
MIEREANLQPQAILSRSSVRLPADTFEQSLTLNASPSFGEALREMCMKSKAVTISRTLKALAITAFCFNFGVVGPTAPMLGATARAQESKAQILQRIRPIIDKANAKQALHQTNAGKYDTAIRNISALEQAPLKTEADVKKAIDILQKNDIEDGMVFGKGFTLAINLSSFKAGARAEADRLSAKGVITQIKSKSLSVSKIGGFNDLKTTLKRQFDGDAAMLKRVGARLQQASKQRGISFSSPVLAPKPSMASAFASGFLSAEAPGAAPARTDAPHSEVAQLDPITGGVLAGIAMAALGYVIAKYAEEKAQDIEENPDTGVSQMGECREEARRDRNRCLNRNEGNFFGQAGCWAQYTIDEAACLLLPL